MQIHIHAFAKLKDYFSSRFTLELCEGATLSDAMKEIVRINPHSSDSLQCCRLVVNQKYVKENYVLNKDEEILLFPPSSGG